MPEEPLFMPDELPLPDVPEPPLMPEEPVLPEVPEPPLMSDEPLLPEVPEPPLMPELPELPEVDPPLPPVVAAPLLELGLLPMPPPVPPPVLCAIAEPANAIAAINAAIEVFLMFTPCWVVYETPRWVRGFNVGNGGKMGSRTNAQLRVGGENKSP